MTLDNKQKTLAIIGASYLQKPLVMKARRMGLRTLCFAWRDGAVCEGLADEFHPISIVEKDEILEICRERNIDGICTIASDVAAPTVAYVAEKLGLTSNSYESALLANNKFLMRNAFVEAGVPCPRYMLLSSVAECQDVRIGFPVIVKPTDRSGSLGVTKVMSEDKLPEAVARALDVSFKKQAIVEEFIEGREISVEFISYHGRHYPLQITDKVTTGAPHFVELEHHQPSSLSPEQYRYIYNLTNRALDALGLTNGASHSEYRITADNHIYVMEIGGRMGGDFIGSDLVRLSTGYDFVRGVIDVALGTFIEPATDIRKHSGVYFLCMETAGLKSVIDSADTFPEIVEACQTDVELRTVTCSADRSGYIIYQADKRWKPILK